MSPAVFQPDEDGTGTIPITFFEAREDPWGLARSEPGPGIAGLDRVLAEKGPRHKSKRQNCRSWFSWGSSTPEDR